LKVLDWGAGRGRLLQAAVDKWQNSTAEFIDYYAYDPDPKDREVCIGQIAITWPAEAENRWFGEFSSVRQFAAGSPFDRILLCNVLHEIPPAEWNARISDMHAVLSPSGYLLIMEDLKLPQGELAYPKGFLILDHGAVRLLFDDQNDILVTVQNNRLASYVIPYSRLHITPESRRRTLEHCRNVELDKIKEIRAGTDRTYVRGVDHLRAAMQFITAYLSLTD